MTSAGRHSKTPLDHLPQHRVEKVGLAAGFGDEGRERRGERLPLGLRVKLCLGLRFPAVAFLLALTRGCPLARESVIVRAVQLAPRATTRGLAAPHELRADRARLVRLR